MVIHWPCRMTFKMYAVDFCELLLYDEQKQAYHMMQHAFHSKDALDAFIRSVYHIAWCRERDSHLILSLWCVCVWLQHLPHGPEDHQWRRGFQVSVW